LTVYSSALPWTLTAYGTPEMSQEALDLGAYCVLDKPFEMNALSPLVVKAHASHI